MAKYIVRLDDIHNRMDNEKFHAVMSILFEHGCVPLLGVIPNNQDSSLDKGIQIESLDDLLRTWAMNGQVDIAMHGYQHRYITSQCGLMSGLGLKPQSEFAGVPLEEQMIKISEGKQLLSSRGLDTDIFMAPGHTFDESTLHALGLNGFLYITDGVGLYPFVKYGITFIPQQIAIPRSIPFPGIITLCIHSDTVNEWFLMELATFAKKHSPDFIRFRDACLNRPLGSNFLNKGFETVYRIIARIKRR